MSDLIGHHFSEPSLLKLALCHRSLGANNNERLEFLGDSILNFIVAEKLYHQLQGAREGQLSRLRSQMVKGETLAVIARELNLGEFIQLGEGELKSGGAERDSILADSVEAVLGAIFLDAGLDAAILAVDRWYGDRFSHLSIADTMKDSKSHLQELLQAKQLPLPDYEVVNIEGEGHAQQFTVRCTIVGLAQAPEGIASSRKKAEKIAAQAVLQLLKKI